MCTWFQFLALGVNVLRLTNQTSKHTIKQQRQKEKKKNDKFES